MEHGPCAQKMNLKNVYICKYLGARIALLAQKLSFVLGTPKENVPEGTAAEKGLDVRLKILAFMLLIKCYFEVKGSTEFFLKH